MHRKTFKDCVYETIHQSDKNPKQIAEDLNVAYGYLARWCLDKPVGCNTPGEQLIALMNATGNYEILKYINFRCGFLPPLKPPRGWFRKKNYNQTIGEYQAHFSEVVNALVKFFEQPTKTRGAALTGYLNEHLERTYKWKLRAEKDIHQLDLFDSDEDED